MGICCDMANTIRSSGIEKTFGLRNKMLVTRVCVFEMVNDFFPLSHKACEKECHLLKITRIVYFANEGKS